MAVARFPVPRLFDKLKSLLGNPASIFNEHFGPDDRLSLRQRLSVGALLLFSELKRAELPVRAAATAYSFVFALIPLFTTTIAFFTAFPGLSNERQRIERALFTNLLPGAAQSAQSYIGQFADRAAAAGAVSSLVFFVVVLMLFDSIESTFNRVWKAERARRWSERFVLLAMFFLIGALGITVMIVVSAQLSLIAERFAALESSPVALLLRRALFGALSLLSSCVLFIVANKWLPNAKVRWLPALIGGGTAGVLWHFLKDAFTWFVTDVASYENVYGAVAVLPVFFLWIYLTVLLLLAGGAVTFVMQNQRTLIAERRMSSGQGPQRAWHAIALLSILARAFERQQAPVSALDLARRLGVAQFVIAESVRPLVQAGVVLAVPQGAEHGYALGVPATALSVARVVALTTGEDLSVPEGRSQEGSDSLRKRVASVFAAARKEEGNALEALTIAELAALAPDQAADGTDSTP